MEYIKFTPWAYYIGLAVIAVYFMAAVWKIRKNSLDDRLMDRLPYVWLALAVIVILNLIGNVNIFLCLAFDL